jgi:hypothetical protein
MSLLSNTETPPTPQQNTLGEIVNVLQVGLNNRKLTYISIWNMIWGTVVVNDPIDPSQRANVFGLSPQQTADVLGTNSLAMFQLGAAEATALPAQAALVGVALSGGDTPGIPTGWSVTPVMATDGVIPTGAVTITYSAT